jgi:hypothetical protein
MKTLARSCVGVHFINFYAINTHVIILSTGSMVSYYVHRLQENSSPFDIMLGDLFCSITSKFHNGVGDLPFFTITTSTFALACLVE